jgi:hypothetical protein
MHEKLEGRGLRRDAKANLRQWGPTSESFYTGEKNEILRFLEDNQVVFK